MVEALTIRTMKKSSVRVAYKPRVAVAKRARTARSTKTTIRDVFDHLVRTAENKKSAAAAAAAAAAAEE